jgi:plasmid stability protein
MAQLIVRRIADDVKERLKARAARHGRSVEAEVRAIIEEAMKGEEAEGAENARVGFGTLMRKRFSKTGLTEEEARLFNEAIEQLRRGSKPRDPGFGR